MCLTLQGEQFPGGGGRVCRWGLILQVRRHHPCGKSMQSLLVAVTLKRPYAGSSVYERVCECVCVCVCVCVHVKETEAETKYIYSAM